MPTACPQNVAPYVPGRISVFLDADRPGDATHANLLFVTDNHVPMVNAVRRMLGSGLAKLSIVFAKVMQNTTRYTDDYIAHRLSQVPLHQLGRNAMQPYTLGACDCSGSPPLPPPDRQFCRPPADRQAFPRRSAQDTWRTVAGITADLPALPPTMPMRADRPTPSTVGTHAGFGVLPDGLLEEHTGTFRFVTGSGFFGDDSFGAPLVEVLCRHPAVVYAAYAMPLTLLQHTMQVLQVDVVVSPASGHTARSIMRECLRTCIDMLAAVQEDLLRLDCPMSMYAMPGEPLGA